MDRLMGRGASLASLAAAVAALGFAGCAAHDGIWNTSTTPSYSCACTCEVQPQMGGSPLNDTIKDVYVCAETVDQAKLRCPGACVYALTAEYDRNDVRSTVTSCEIAETPVAAAENACLTAPTGVVAAIPRDASLEGPVDFGLSTLQITVPATDDAALVHVAGKVAAVGGNCPG